MSAEPIISEGGASQPPEKTVGVFCGAEDIISDAYKLAGHNLGNRIAKAGFHLVTGGSQAGLMKSVMDGFVEEAGVYSESNSPEHHWIPETLAVPQRLALFHEKCSIVMVMPGGLGTLHELMDFMDHNQFAPTKTRIILINMDGFWGPLLDQFKMMLIMQTLTENYLTSLKVVNSIWEGIQFLETLKSGNVKLGLENDFWKQIQ